MIYPVVGNPRSDLALGADLLLGGSFFGFTGGSDILLSIIGPVCCSLWWTPSMSTGLLGKQAAGNRGGH